MGIHVAWVHIVTLGYNLSIPIRCFIVFDNNSRIGYILMDIFKLILF